MPEKRNHPVSMVFKRAMDVLVSSLILLLTLPLLLFVSVLIRMTMGTPIFFRQIRPGLAGRPFSIYKFRTMRNAFDSEGNPLPDADRLTPTGYWIRKLSIDELPQMMNVLKGEMSLVGPRPLLMQYLDRYTPEQARRHDVKPGITGWAQISGRNAISWEEKFACDVWYVDHWSFGLDVRILFRTFWQTLFCRGISAEGHATMQEFMGRQEGVNG